MLHPRCVVARATRCRCAVKANDAQRRSSACCRKRTGELSVNPKRKPSSASEYVYDAHTMSRGQL